MTTDDDHAAIWAYESAACQPTAWERWIDQVEALLGRSVDGDQRVDGFSLDGFYENWKASMSPAEAVAAIPNTSV